MSANTLAELQSRAVHMRRNPTEPETRVWRILSGSQLNGFKFRRQAVLAPFIVDFLCPAMRLIVEVDGDTHDGNRDDGRDDLLASRDYRVLRISNSDVMNNLVGVYDTIRAALASSRRASPAATPHPNPSPEREGLTG